MAGDDKGKRGKPRRRVKGTDRVKCKAKSSRTGLPCKNDAMVGQLVCGAHGGRAPQAKAAGDRRYEEQAARAEAELMVSKLGLDEVLEHEDPLTGLLDEIARSRAAVAYYAARVRDLTLEQQVVTSPFGTFPHVWLRLWAEERERHAKLAAAGIRAGLAERQVRVAENVALAIVGAIDDLLEYLDLTAAQRAEGRQFAGQRLRELAGGGSSPAG